MKLFNCVVYGNEVRDTINYILNLLLTTSSILTVHKQSIHLSEAMGLYEYVSYDAILRSYTENDPVDNVLTRIIGYIGRVKIDVDITKQSIHVKCKRGRTTNFHVVIKQSKEAGNTTMVFLRTYDKEAIRQWFPGQFDRLMLFEKSNGL